MIWLDAAGVEAIAAAILGDAATVRDHGLLDSAVNRARNAYVYLGVSTFEAAAYYAAGIAKNHPFVDGNKRIAWMTAVAFLDLNGFDAVPKNDASAVSAMVGLASGQLTIDYMAGYLAGCARQR